VNTFEKARRIIEDCDTVYIGLIDQDGYPIVSTIEALNPKSLFEVYFATGTRSNKYRCLQKNAHGSVCYHKGGDNVTLIGDVEVLADQPTKTRFWQKEFAEFYPLGEIDPVYCILKFTTQRGLLWIDNESVSFSIDDIPADKPEN